MSGAGPRPGASMPDAPIVPCGGEAVFLTEASSAGTRFTLLAFTNGEVGRAPEGIAP